MPDVIHRTTLEFKESASFVKHPEPTWKHNPDMSGVQGVPNRYWKAPVDWDAVGAGPLEMTQAEKNAIDAQILSDQRDAVAAALDRSEDIFRAFTLALLNERNRMATKFNTLLDGIRTAGNLADIKTVANSITDEPIRTTDDIKTGIRNNLGA